MAGKVLNFKIKIVETNCESDPPTVCSCGHDQIHNITMAAFFRF